MAPAFKVDEKYYLPKSKKELSTHPEAKKLVLSRASFLEIEIEISEPGSLIEWEFETKTRDVGFGVFRKEIVDGEERITELVPLLRLDTEAYAETGFYQCEKAGTRKYKGLDTSNTVSIYIIPRRQMLGSDSFVSIKYWIQGLNMYDTKRRDVGFGLSREYKRIKDWIQGLNMCVNSHSLWCLFD